MSGPGWFEAEITRRLGTLATAGVTQAANVAAAAALTSIDLVPALGTPDATGDLTALTGADAAQDNNNATISAQFNALRADLIELRAQVNAEIAALKAAKLQLSA